MQHGESKTRNHLSKFNWGSTYSLRTLDYNEPPRIVESESLAPQEIGSDH